MMKIIIVTIMMIAAASAVAHRNTTGSRRLGVGSKTSMSVPGGGTLGSRIHRRLAARMRAEPQCRRFVQSYPFHIPIGDADEQRRARLDPVGHGDLKLLLHLSTRR